MIKTLFLIALYGCTVLFTGCEGTAHDTPQQSVSAVAEGTTHTQDEVQDMKITMTVNEKELAVTLADTAAAQELAQKVREGAVTVTLGEYGGFEKVGTLPWALTRNDESISTSPGDIMLYQGNQMTVFYGTNSWSYTRLGRIDDITAQELETLFGEGDITVTLS